MLDLYQRIFEGTPLSGDEDVISADEKTSIQARCRCHPTLPPARARAMRVEHESDRGGALAYLSGRLGSPPGTTVWPLRGLDWDRAVRSAGRPGHDHRAHALAQRVYIHQLPQTAPRVAGLIEGLFGPAATARRTRATSGQTQPTQEQGA